MYHDSRFSQGNARSRAPIMSGIRKLPSTAGIDGTRKKKIMTTPCMVKSRLYSSGERRTSPCWRHQLEPHHRGGGPSHEEEERDRGHVQEADPLVVVGQEPRLQRVCLEIVFLELDRRRAH